MKLISSQFDKNENSVESLSAKNKALSNVVKEQKKLVDHLTKGVESSTEAFGENDSRTQKWAAELNNAKAKLNNLEREVEQNEKAIKNFSTEIKDADARISKFGESLKKVTVAIGASITAAVGAAAKIGLDFNRQIESYTTNFGVMLGSQEKAIAKVEELKQMAAKTPFGMSDLASATETLLSFQVPAEQTTDILSMLGDISLGNKEKLSGLALVFGQVSSAGKLTGQDLLQFINQGFNPLNYIAQRTGESMEQLRDRMSKGSISAEEVAQAFKDATSEGGQFFKGMEEGSKTTDGLFSTLKDSIATKLGEVFSSVSSRIKEILPQITEFVESIDTDKMVEGIQNVVQNFKDLIPVVAGATTAFIAFKTAMLIASVIQTVKKALEGVTTTQQALNLVMGANPILKIVSLVFGLIAALVVLWKTNEGFREAVTGIWESIKGAFTSAWEAISTVWSGAGEFFGGIWEGIKIAFAAVQEWFSGIFTAAWEGIKIIWAPVGDYFSAVWQTIEGIFAVVKAVLSGDFQGAWDAIKGIASVWAEYFQGVWDDIKNVFSDAYEWGKDIINSMWDGLKSAWNSVVDWFTGVWDSLFGNREANVTVNTHENRTVTTTTKPYKDGSFATGLWRVPFDGFMAEVHKDEMIVPADIAASLRGLSATGNSMASFGEGIVNGIAGAVGNSGSQPINCIVQLDGKTLASVMFDPLRGVAKQRGVAFG